MLLGWFFDDEHYLQVYVEKNLTCHTKVRKAVSPAVEYWNLSKVGSGICGAKNCLETSGRRWVLSAKQNEIHFTTFSSIRKLTSVFSPQFHCPKFLKNQTYRRELIRMSERFLSFILQIKLTIVNDEEKSCLSRQRQTGGSFKRCCWKTVESSTRS